MYYEPRVLRGQDRPLSQDIRIPVSASLLLEPKQTELGTIMYKIKKEKRNFHNNDMSVCQPVNKSI